jgi:hypothetical protein
LSDCRIFRDGRVRFLVVEVLILSTPSVEVIGRFGIVNVRNEFNGTFEQVVPVYSFEERMSLDFFGTSCTESSSSVGAEESIDEIASVGGDFDLAFVPVESTREDVVKHLLGCFVVEGREAVDESAEKVRLISETLSGGSTMYEKQKLTRNR